MKRYKALALRTEDMGFIEPHLTNEWGTYDVYLASDVAELERKDSGVCEWETIGCGIGRPTDHIGSEPWRYCPFCGKPIGVKA